TLFLVLLALRGLVIWARDVRLTELSLGFVDHWRKQLFHALGSAPWPDVANVKQARIHHIINTDVARIAMGTQRVMRGGASVALLGVQLVVAFTLSPIFTLFALIFGATILFLLAPLTRRSRLLGERLTRSGGEVHSILGRFLAGMKLAKAQGVEKLYV